ncbi:reverse transcriptase domain-containing protein, partial [Tanacetum coccineum]
MGHHDSPKYLAQLDALELYLQLILKPHSDHYVGVYGLAGIFGYLIVEPTNTNDISDIMTIVRRSQICMRGKILLIRALRTIMQEHEDVLTRMVMFIGGPLWDSDYVPNTYCLGPNTYGLGEYSTHKFTAPSYTCLGTSFKEMGVAVDVINFGTQQEGFKKNTLCVFLAAANNNGNTRMVDRSGHHDLDASSFLALVGNGRTGLESVLLMQGDDFQNHFDKVLADSFCHRKEKQDDKGHDEDEEICGDRGDRYDQKQDDRGNDDTRDRKRKHFDKGHDEGRETYRDRGDRHDQKQDDTTSRCFRIRLSVDISSNSSIREARGHDEGRKRHRDRGYGHGRRQDDNMMRVGKDIRIEVMGMAENKIIDVMMRDGKYIGIEVIGMAEK